MANNAFDYCPSLRNLISDGEAQGVTGKRFEEIAAISTLNNLAILRQIIIKEAFTNTLEIGLAFGGSALTILSTMREHFPNASFLHTAIDPFQRTVWDSLALSLIEKENLDRHFALFEGFSSVVLPDLIRQQKKYGLIYIDGSHLFEDVFVDFVFACDLLKENGIAVFDDCTDKHVAKVIRFIQTNYSKILMEIDLDEFAKPASLKARIGRMCGYRQARGFRKTSAGRREWNSPFRTF